VIHGDGLLQEAVAQLETLLRGAATDRPDSSKEKLMHAQTRPAIHGDHRHWQNDIKMWREDVQEWQKEQAKLLADVEIALGANNTALNHHITSIGEHEGKIARHEHFIAECERSLGLQAGEVETGLTEAHQKEAGAHVLLRQLHERIKRHHHRAMARLAIVRQALEREV